MLPPYFKMDLWKKTYEYFKKSTFNLWYITGREQVTSPTPRKMTNNIYEVQKDAAIRHELSGIIEGIL